MGEEITEVLLNLFKDWVKSSLLIFGIAGIIGIVFRNKIPPGIALVIMGGLIGFVLGLGGFGIFLILVGFGVIFLFAPICLFFFGGALLVAIISALV